MIGVTRPSVTSYQQPVWELSSCQLSAPHSHSRQEDSSLTVAEREVEPGRPHWVIPARPRQSAQLPAVASCSCAGAGAGHQRPHYLNDVEWPRWCGRVPGGGQEGIPSSAPPAAAWPRTKAGCCSLAAPQQSLGPRSARLRSCRTLAAARGHCGLAAGTPPPPLCPLYPPWPLLLAAAGPRRRSAWCLLSALQLHSPLSPRNATHCLSSGAMYRVQISRYLLRSLHKSR